MGNWFSKPDTSKDEEQQKKDESYGFNYEEFNIYDNLSITNEKLKKVLSTYDRNSIWFKRDILGKRVASESFLFTPLIENEEKFYTDKPNISYISTGVDFGGNGSAHAFVTSSVSRSYNGVDVLRADRTEIIDDIHAKLKQLKEAFKKHILFVQGSGFNIDDQNHFRIVFLADYNCLKKTIDSLEDFLNVKRIIN